MNDSSTLLELYRHHDWASARVIALAEAVEDEKLDRGFEMGVGSLRKTLWHIAGAHWVWMMRIAGKSPTRFPADDGAQSIPELRQFWDTSRAQRSNIFDSISSDRDLERQIEYRDLKSDTHVARLDDILLHAANHAQHHHAQASNMLRHLGATAPRLDYIFMIHENPPTEPAKLSTRILKEYFAYTDWARDRVLDVAQTLDEASLDRPCEMGIGSIRKNMVHTHGAEAWWLGNWTSGANEPFPKPDERVGISELRERFRGTAEKRSAFLAQTSDDELSRPVKVKASNGQIFQFPLGVSMLQLCNHGTHHRAQTINMLRQCGKTMPATDYILMKREQAAS